MARILFVSDALIGPVMAGSGVRVWEMAQALAREHDVALALTRPGPSLEAPPVEAPFPVLRCTTAQLRREILRFDVIISANFPPLLLPFLRHHGKYLVVDLYDPVIVEESARFQEGQSHARDYQERLRATLLQLRAGDFFLCANKRQRLFWLGMLSAVGRLQPSLHHQNRILERTIAVVPSGIPEEPPRSSRAVLKGVYPGIASDDQVILWGGGIWSWMDAATLLYALADLARRRDDVKLFFMGIHSPDPRVPTMEAGRRAVTLSQELGLFNHTVFFNEQWVPYNERADYLLGADLGVSLHQQGLESELSARIRVMDYLWAGLPVVVNEGDRTSELVTRAGLGLVVPCGQKEPLYKALLRLLDDQAFRQHCQKQIEASRSHWFWSKFLPPLSAYCRHPWALPRGEGMWRMWARVLYLYARRLGYTWQRGGWSALWAGLVANLGAYGRKENPWK